MKLLCRLLGHDMEVQIPLHLYRQGNGPAVISAEVRCLRCKEKLFEVEPLKPRRGSDGEWKQRIGGLSYKEYLKLKAEEAERDDDP